VQKYQKVSSTIEVKKREENEKGIPMIEDNRKFISEWKGKRG